MDDNAKRVGSAVVTTILVILWIALKAGTCDSESDYDYDYTPSYSYTPSIPNYESALDRTQKALDELMAKDAAWEPAIQAVDPIAIAANPKNLQCQALDDVVEQTPTWKIDVAETVMVGDVAETTIKSPYPLYVTREGDSFPKVSPETIARSHVLIEKIIEGSYPSVPTLTTRDLVIDVGVMPRPAKRAKKVKGAPAPGKVIARGWIYDHREQRVVCAGVLAVPGAGTGEDATRIDEAQLQKLVEDVPSALKTVPLPKVESE